MSGDHLVQPTISIITVCYNSVRTIEKTIQSVLGQQGPSLEYIVIDGGSSDGTQEVIKKYAAQLAYWVSEPDRGISDAFNKGIAQASGDVIGLLNSDDYYLPGTLEQVVTAFAQQPDIGFVFGDQMFVDADDNVLFYQKGDPDFASRISNGMPSVPHPATFVRRQIYAQYGGFDLSYQTAMDYELLLRFHRMGVVGYYLPQALSAMRTGGESDRNFARAYAEVRDISIRYGYNRQLAYLLYGWRVTKTSFRQLLEQKGLTGLVGMFRRMFSQRYTYE